MASNDSGDTHFDVVLRGYDREQVDERLRFLAGELTTAEQALSAARERSVGLEEELASARGELGQRVPDPDVGFGNRVEKILRLAEEEAAEIRQRASDEASSLLEKARAESEQMVGEATREAQQRVRQGEQEVERLNALRDDVQERLRSTKNVLDEHFDPSWHSDG